MIIILHKKFKKKYEKLSKSHQKKFKEKRNLFLKEQFHPTLNNHVLHGKLSNYRSFSIAGDLRVLYQQIDNHTVLFADVDTHSNLYS